MKKAIIVTLVCVNVGLLLGLMLGPTIPRANAQAVRGGTDYLMVTGNMRRDLDAVYVIDLGKRRMLAWEFNRTSKKLTPFRGRDLRTDFERGKDAEGL